MTVYSPALDAPWSFSFEDERRFQRILVLNLAVFLILGLVMPVLPLPEIERALQEELPPRMARLILDREPVKPPPPPVVAPEPEPAPKQVEQVKPKPKPKQERKKPQAVTPAAKPAPVKKTVSARKQAEQAGLLALKDSLQDLRQNTVASNLKQTRNLSQAGGQARKTERAILTAGTTAGSGGINTATLSRNTGGTALAQRTTTRIHTPVGNASGGGGGSATHARASRRAGRSIEEIQMIFDRNKGSIYSVYNRALRKDPTLQGKLVLRLSIAPSGQVVRCEVVSSELHDGALGNKIAQRVKLFNFGSKDVEQVTITYPIDFLPA